MKINVIIGKATWSPLVLCNYANMYTLLFFSIFRIIQNGLALILLSYKTHFAIAKSQKLESTGMWPWQCFDLDHLSTVNTCFQAQFYFRDITLYTSDHASKDRQSFLKTLLFTKGLCWILYWITHFLQHVIVPRLIHISWLLTFFIQYSKNIRK